MAYTCGVAVPVRFLSGAAPIQANEACCVEGELCFENPPRLENDYVKSEIAEMIRQRMGLRRKCFSEGTYLGERVVGVRG